MATLTAFHIIPHKPALFKSQRCPGTRLDKLEQRAGECRGSRTVALKRRCVERGVVFLVTGCGSRGVVPTE
jgi:hypothetical protein